MSYLFLIIIMLSIYIFKWQEKRHQFERSLFYTYDQLQQNMIIPKRDMVESSLVVCVGATLLEMGIIFLWTAISVYEKLGHSTDEKTQTLAHDVAPQQFIFASIFLAGGIAVLILGVRSVIVNVKYKKLKN